MATLSSTTLTTTLVQNQGPSAALSSSESGTSLSVNRPLSRGTHRNNAQFSSAYSQMVTSRRFVVYGAALAITGAVSIFIGSVASLLEAEKTYHMHNFVNTHWVTTVFLFAGISAWLREHLRTSFFLYLTVCLCLVSLPIGIGAIFADAMNLHILRGGTWPEREAGGKSWYYLSPLQITAMVVYSAVDLVNSVCATTLALLLLREISKVAVRHFSAEVSYKSLLLLAGSIALTAISSLRVILWIIEMVWVRQLGPRSRFMFLHYTVDEPVWLCVFVMVGLMNLFVALRGSRVVMSAAVALTALSLYPSFLYLWLDYRWYSNVKMTELTVNMPKQDNVLLANIWLGILHVMFIVSTIIEQVRLVTRTGTDSVVFSLRLHVDRQLQRAIAISGVLFIVAASAFLFSDIVNLLSRTFFRVFYPTEQKLPLQLYAVGVFCLLALKERIAMCFLPITFVVLLAVMHTCTFHVAAYLYLAYHKYFHENLCELFHFGSNGCDKKLSRVGAISHFFEAAMALCVFALCVYVLTVVVRLFKMHPIKTGALTLQELKRKQWCESIIALIAGVQLMAGVIVLLLSCQLFGIGTFSSNTSHPLLVIHSVIYRSCLSLALIIYPTAQLAFARQLLFYPLRSMAICALSMFRFVEIITQLDYRNIGQDAGLAWTVFSAVEVCSLLAHFASLCLCAVLFEIAASRPQFDFVDFGERTGVASAPLTAQTTGADYSDNPSVPPTNGEHPIVGYSVNGGTGNASREMTLTTDTLDAEKYLHNGHVLDSDVTS